MKEEENARRCDGVALEAVAVFEEPSPRGVREESLGDGMEASMVRLRLKIDVKRFLRDDVVDGRDVSEFASGEPVGDIEPCELWEACVELRNKVGFSMEANSAAERPLSIIYEHN